MAKTSFNFAIKSNEKNNHLNQKRNKKEFYDSKTEKH